MKYFWYLPKKKVIFLFTFSVKEKTYFFPSHFLVILLGSARLLGANAVCTQKMVYKVILINGYKEICGLTKQLEVAVGLTSRTNRRYVNSKVTSKCDVSCFI